MACAGGEVLEYSPADWAVIEELLSALHFASIAAPGVFAPAEWP